MGPISPLKNALYGNDQHLVSFHAIHLGWLAKKTLTSVLESCGKSATRGHITYFFHETIVNYLRTIDSQPQFCVKIVSSLPKQITERYYTERNATGYEIPLD